ncbi:hypothetical protein QIS99_28995 [Streptomyces sp. B-S-A8]|uniref:Uncharacterized protein n=1 Tax=Streptomyces solicavernae TaxID=3043614 RepID=A0ABT6S0I6_9ACTN|nr:hypothetical protein [Streptomyces sp. B-S-A8]MDI3390198.1 hypothetical protein [Streptomyces sp. B-S-A8]
MTDAREPHGPPQEYVEEFLRRAEPALDDLFARRGGQLENLAAVRAVGEDGLLTIHAITVVTFRGGRFSYRRRIWPPSHPPATQAGIYATMLEERLLTRAHPADGTGGETPIEL